MNQDNIYIDNGYIRLICYIL